MSALGGTGSAGTGYDGQRKQVIYVLDRIDAEVIGSVEIDGSAFRYSYRVRVLPIKRAASDDVLDSDLSKDVHQVDRGDFPLPVSGPASNLTPKVPGSRWFAYFPKDPPAPREAAVFGIVSASPPALVECRVSGTTGAIQGVGEELPPELEGALLGANAWPRGYTIGPSDELKTLAPAAKVDRLRAWLPEFERLGWMTPGARERYERTVGQGGIASLLPLLEPDVATGQVTSEVVAIVQGLARQ